jgi:sigma-E factor negative regulatory protein RseC
MSEEVAGRVTRVGPSLVRVSVSRQSACGSCAQSGGCGVAALSRLGTSSTVELDLPPGVPVTAGDRVVLTIPSSSLLRYVSVLFGLPILGLLLFVLSGSYFQAGDLIVALMGLSGLLSGAAFARFFLGLMPEPPVTMRVETGTSN